MTNDDPVVGMLRAARMALVYQNPLIGEIALSLDLVILENPTWCSTAAVDGKRIYVYRGFVLEQFHDAGDPMTRQNGRRRIIAILAHEVWHVIFQHLIRRGNIDPDIYAMAIDYIVNAFISEEQIGLLPAGALLDKRFHSGLTTEQVCLLIKKLKIPITTSMDVHLEPETDDAAGGTVADDASPSRAEPMTFAEPSGEIVTDTGDTRPAPLSAEAAKEQAAEIRATVARAYQNEAGNVPASLSRELDDFINPKMDWRSLIEASLRSIEKSEYTFDELSDLTWASWSYHRRRWKPDCGYQKSFCAILPSQNEGELIRVVVAVDASASITAAVLREQLSEVIGIAETFVSFEITIMSFDTEVYNLETFTHESLQEMHEYVAKKVRGGGGTSFPAVWAELYRQEIVPDRLIMFTDGLPANNDWGDPDYCDTLFIIHNNNTRGITAPFGQTVYFE